MDERDALLASIAGAIGTYRRGELAEPTPEHVDRWAAQFSAHDNVAFLREFDHVVRRAFLTRADVERFLDGLIANRQLAGADPAVWWSQANLLRLQKVGQSQIEMIEALVSQVEKQCGIVPFSVPTGDVYLYLDDVLFTGARIAADLEAWIASGAPARAVVHIVVVALHTHGEWQCSERLGRAIGASGKRVDIRFWRSRTLENRLTRKDRSDVLWPTAIPDDAVVADFLGNEGAHRLALRSPGGSSRFFSAEAGRQILEREFLIAGARIKSLSRSSAFLRPLGCSNFGAGFGSMLVTYRNCPNNCPLALWWGDPKATSGALHWYPLLSRKTNAAAEHAIDVVA